MISIRTRSRTTPDVAGKVIAGVRRGIRSGADLGYIKSQEEVPVDTGELRASGFVPRWDGDVLEWGYRADHARYVEEGTRPHWPPIEPLKGWARRVLGDESAAWAVQRKIALRGTPAQPFVEPGFREMVREIERRGLTSHIDAEFR